MRLRAYVPTNRCPRRRLVHYRGGAAFYTCARLGGPSSFSPNAANMVSIAGAGSMSDPYTAPALPGLGAGGEQRRSADLRYCAVRFPGWARRKSWELSGCAPEERGEGPACRALAGSRVRSLAASSRQAEARIRTSSKEPSSSGRSCCSRVQSVRIARCLEGAGRG